MIVEQQIIRPSHQKYKTIDEMCSHSKDLYNYANYLIRQSFIINDEYISYRKMNFDLKTHELYKLCMSQPANCLLRRLDKVWKSYFESIKDWSKNPSKYLGKPKIPKYLKKDGRYCWEIPNNTCSIKDGYIVFKMKKLNDIKWRTHLAGKLIQVRFVPNGCNYIMEVVVEEKQKETPQLNQNNIASIDLGVDNFVTLTNNIGLNPIIINGRIIKSINQFYNKRRAELQSKLPKDIFWSKQLDSITFKRFNRIKNFIHHASKFIVDYCVKNNIGNLVCGLNKEWKQNSKMSKKTNQNFVGIPYNMLIKQLEYKCKQNGIIFQTTEESYTSGTSFMDGEIPVKENYDKSRRIRRGLFKWSDGYINADVNGSLQIMKKVFPNAFADGIVVYLIPIRINLINSNKSRNKM